MSNEATIEAHLAELQARAEAFKTQAEGYLTDIQTLSLRELDLDTVYPNNFNFTVPDVVLTDEATTVIADFDTGLQYPSSSDILDAVLAGAYDSEFLEYLEQQTKNTPLAAWGVALNSLRATYRDEVTGQATTYVANIIPMFSAYVSAMQSQVTDTQARHETDFLNRWAGIMNDAAVQVAQDSLRAGIAIEDVRERSIAEMVRIYSDYNRAVLDRSKVQFNALLTKVAQVREQIELRIQRHVLHETHDFDYDMNEQRTELLHFDTVLTEMADEMRRQMADVQLDLGRSTALVDYMKSAIASSQLSKGLFTVYQSTSEA